MVRRVFVTGLGAVGGLAGGFPLLHVFLPQPVFLGWRILAPFAVGGSALALGVFEKLRIIPTGTQLEKQQRPISLFSNDDESHPR